MAVHTFTCIDGHTCGNPVRLVAGGGPRLVGADMLEKRAHFLREFDWIRTGLMFEPRGHDMMSGSILYPPTRDDCDVAVLFIETSGCLPMCGHGTIGLVATLAHLGRIRPGAHRIETAKAGKLTQFIKDVSLMGGLILAAVDTEGKPGVAYRAKLAGEGIERTARQARKSAAREAKLAARAKERAQFQKDPRPFGGLAAEADLVIGAVLVPGAKAPMLVSDDLVARMKPGAVLVDDGARLAASLGLEVHAGHGLTFDTVGPIAAIPELAELNIGHFLIAESVFLGLGPAIREMRRCMDAVRSA